MQKEQRRHPRYTVDLSATFFNDGASGLAKVGDISLGGCRIESHVVVGLNEVGQLLIELPGSHPLKVSHAIVRWVLGKECGIEFLKVDMTRIASIRSRPERDFVGVIVLEVIASYLLV